MDARVVSPARPRAGAGAAERAFDGVVCFGGVDWWYHNRGHYDLQMMRELSRVAPVLYVNSIGMRTPSPREGAMFARRVARKLRSLARGLVRVRPGFAVLSPLVAPGRLGALTAPLLAPQVRLAARRLGIRRPLVWIACPPAAAALPALPRAGLVYQRTDRTEAFPGVDAEAIAAHDRACKQAADLVLFCSRHLHDAEAEACRAAALVDHGVDYERFAAAGAAREEPADLAALPRPRAGFVGGIDAHTFDPELFCQAASLLPDVSFPLVGGCSLPEGWCTLPNVRLLGRRPYEDVAGYMAGCDVLLMPWRRGPWIEACNPVKLKEYLAVGRPVVSTPFPELAGYGGLVRTAEGPEAFAAAIRSALAAPDDPERLRARARGHGWDARAGAVLERLREIGLRPAVARPSRKEDDRHGG